MPNRFESLLERGFNRWVDSSITPQNNGCFRGGNAPLFVNGKFLSDDQNHCPRVALSRLWGYEEEKSVNTLMSHEVGRSFEEMVYKALLNAGVAGMTITREEEAQLCLEIDGVVRYTQRPDMVVNDPGAAKPYALEFKSIQSGSVAEQIFHHHKPKLGALIQLCSVMHLGNFTRGFLVYGLQSFLSSYSYTQKKKLAFKPSVKAFECNWLRTTLVVDGRKTIVDAQAIVDGIQELVAVADGRLELPPVPTWVDMFGDPAKYVGCTYCPWRGPCETIKAQRNETCEAFREQIELQGAAKNGNEE